MELRQEQFSKPNMLKSHKSDIALVVLAYFCHGFFPSEKLCGGDCVFGSDVQVGAAKYTIFK